jgi:hypothetical protein
MGQRATIALHVENDTAKLAFKQIAIDPSYLDKRVPGLPAYSVNYALAGTQIPVFGSSMPANSIVDDGPMSQHHGPTYRTLLELPATNGGLPSQGNEVLSAGR